MAPSAVAHAEGGKPAMVAEAVRVLDLSVFPRFGGEDGKEGTFVQRSVASQTYEAEGSVKEAYAFVQKALAERKWAEAPGGVATDEYASGTFTRDGFTLAASVSPAGKPGAVMVSLTNLGNVAPGSLPKPAGATALYIGPAIASYASGDEPRAVAEALRKSLVEAGWTPYGEVPGSLVFKQNAIRLNVQVSEYPAQAGKAAVSYTTALMSADLPAPPDAEGVQFAEVTTTLAFDSPSSLEDLAAFYRRELAAAGWTPTTGAPLEDDFKHVLLFRNSAGDLLTLEVRDVDGKRRVQLIQKPAAEVEAMLARAKAAGHARMERREVGDAARPAPKPRVTLAVPRDARKLKRDGSTLEFQLPNGRARAVVDGWRARLVKDGWAEQAATLEPMAGAVTLKKGDQTLAIHYTDTGFLPSEVGLLAVGVEVEPEAAAN